MDVFESYKQFCDIREKSETTKTIDLSHLTFLSPTTLLPLLVYIKINKDKKYISPLNELLNNYIQIIECNTLDSCKDKTFLPIINYQKNKKKQIFLYLCYMIS